MLDRCARHWESNKRPERTARVSEVRSEASGDKYNTMHRQGKGVLRQDIADPNIQYRGQGDAVTTHPSKEVGASMECSSECNSETLGH